MYGDTLFMVVASYLMPHLTYMKYMTKKTKRAKMYWWPLHSSSILSGEQKSAFPSRGLSSLGGRGCLSKSEHFPC